MSRITVDVDSSRGKMAVRRNLFGTIDHEQIQEDLRREMKLISEEKKRKWNFDFENFKPLHGRYKWERVHGRLQTRKSPTEMNPPLLATTEAGPATEGVCHQRSVDPTGVTTRYNLRMRGKGLENIDAFNFQSIDPSREQLRDFGATPSENRCGGNFESKRNAKGRKATSSLVKVRRQRKKRSGKNPP